MDIYFKEIYSSNNLFNLLIYTIQIRLYGKIFEKLLKYFHKQEFCEMYNKSDNAVIL